LSKWTFQFIDIKIIKAVIPKKGKLPLSFKIVYGGYLLINTMLGKG
jgi:hypothetical protein